MRRDKLGSQCAASRAITKTMSLFFPVSRVEMMRRASPHLESSVEVYVGFEMALRVNSLVTACKRINSLEDADCQ